MQITAAVARAAGAPFSIETVDLEDPRADEIRERVHAVGVCHTDIVAQTGAMGFSFPAVLGHEGAGIVEAVGTDVRKVAVGDRVALTFRSCGSCDRCERGDRAYCRTMPLLNYIGMRPDGSKSMAQDGDAVSSNFFGQSSFATHALAYESNVIKIPGDLPFELAAPLGCGVQTGVGGVLLALKCEAGSSIVITGAGSVGLSGVMGAAIASCARIIVVEPMAARREMALELGATDVIDPASNPDIAHALRALAPLGVDYAFDTTGRADILNAIMGALGSKGQLAIVGIPPAGSKLPGDLGAVLTFGQSVRGVIEGDSNPDVFLPELIAHWRAGRLPLEKLVRTWPFAQINEAIDAQHRGDAVKVVLTL